VTALQLGHLGEHAFQVTEYAFLNGTLACPPPADQWMNMGTTIEAIHSARPTAMMPIFL